MIRKATAVGTVTHRIAGALELSEIATRLELATAAVRCESGIRKSPSGACAN